MEIRSIPTPTFKLKVAIKCCTRCQHRAIQRLRKITGVKSASYDAEQGMVIVSGEVDPNLLIKKFAEWGKEAELWSFTKDTTPCNCCSHKQACDPPVKVKNEFDHVVFVDDEDNKTEIIKPTMENQNLLVFNNIPVPKKKNSGNCFWGFLVKKIFGECLKKIPGSSKNVKKLPSNVNAGKVWQFQKTPELPPQQEQRREAPPPPPLFPPPFEQSRHPFGQMMPSQNYYSGPMFSFPPLQPPLPPQPPMLAPPMLFAPTGPGPRFYRPRSPPRFNPMIHYTSYEDNYR